MKLVRFLYFSFSVSNGLESEADNDEVVTDEIDYELSDQLVDSKGIGVEEYPIIVGSSSQQVFSISSIDGDIHWMKTIGEGVNAVPVISLENVAYVTGNIQSLVII